MADWIIERFDDSHERGEFCCGKAPLDNFIKTLAGQYERKGVGRTFVAVQGADRRVAGYYTLALGAVSLPTVPRVYAKKLPKHPVTVVLLGRLAVDTKYQGHGLGEHLLFDAFQRILAIAEQAGAFAVEVVAINQGAKQFYEKYGFTPLTDQELHSFLPLATIRKGLTE